MIDFNNDQKKFSPIHLSGFDLESKGVLVNTSYCPIKNPPKGKIVQEATNIVFKHPDILADSSIGR